MNAPANLAARVADRLRGLPAPWDVFAERSRRFEVHLNGPTVTLTRGPMLLEGFGVRVLRSLEDQVGVGFRSSTVLSDDAVRTAADGAEKLARFNRFPAKNPQLPSERPTVGGGPKVVDPTLRSDPFGAIDRYVAALVAAMDGRKTTVLSFGSVKATLTEASVANSTGLTFAYAHTAVETEVAVKAFGGPEGRPPGEYWFIDVGRRIDPGPLSGAATEWARFAEDARHAKPPPNGELPVLLPSEVLAGFIPAVLRFQCSAVAKLRGLALEPGSQVGPEGCDVLDEGTFDWGIGSAPIDDEGTRRGTRTLVSNGRAQELLFDSLYANALGATSTGNGGRASFWGGGRNVWRKFTRRPAPDVSTVMIPAGKGGPDPELIEQVEDGIWVQQLGDAQPDALSGRFGGEIRIGYRVRHGKLSEPIRGGTVGGVVVAREGAASLLRDLIAVGSTPKLVGELSSPTLLVRSLAISGNEPPAPSGAV